MHIFKYIPTVSVLASTYAATTSFCKRDPSSPQWPSAEQWQALNSSVSGSLRVPVALGTVCHPDQPNFNNASCSALAADRTNTSYVAQNPWMADYNDETCLPSPLAPCSAAGYPAYVIEAKSAADVAAGLKFAKDTQVRLIVKGTGHDFPGRSSGPGSLSIWTHNIRGIEVTMNDPKAVQYGGVASVKIAAGMRMREIYTEVAKCNLTVVGGADPGVGIGGWITAGGHSPISGKFGLGADQVLQMEVVTADGQVLSINETCHEDLFWAMRGGGGSTYAVLSSVTIKAYPSISGTVYAFTYNTTANSDTFWSLVSHFHADLPRVSAQGGMGYYYIRPVTGEGEASILGGWFYPQRTVEQVNETANLFTQMLNQSPSWATDKIATSSQLLSFPDFTSSWLQTNPGETGGTFGRLGSWLLDAKSLTTNMDGNTARFRKLSPDFTPLLGHLVTGEGTHNPVIPGGSSGVLPAWRTAVTHLIAVKSWTPFNLTQKSLATKLLRDDVQATLRSFAPGSGAYVNEADPTNPHWKNDYYGANYESLLDIKHKYDPDGVFWCRPCVGYDEWEVVDGPAGEDKENWGVAQVGGRICRKS